MKALIDADVLSYAVPFALQDKNGLKGSKWDVRFNLDKMVKLITEEAKTEDFQLYLSGDTNFRNELATISPYKGNRKQAKPILYPYFRELCIEEYGAIVSDGEEADDSISIEQNKDKDNNVICSLDKDFKQCHGWHYNWPIRRKGKIVRPSSLHYIDELEAIQHLYAQAITGDTTDNILYADGKKVAFLGKGEKFAYKLLDKIKDEEDAKARVMEFYYKEWDSDNMGISWKDAFEEIMSLLTLRVE